MKPKRRQFLKILGGGTIVAAGGAGAFLATRTPGRALAPWDSAGQGYDDPRLTALSWAILAPNPHNRQPWVVGLDGDDGFTLFAQSDRKLPHTDPYDRQITIGLGCFLELTRIAAGAIGYEAGITPFPEGQPFPVLDGRPVAQVKLTRTDQKPDPLFSAVPERRSCKEPYDLTRPVSTEDLGQLAGLSDESITVQTAVDDETVEILRDIGWRSHLIESETPRTYMESVELMRVGKTQIESNPDGIALGGPLLDTLQLLGIFNKEKLADKGSAMYLQGLTIYQELHANTPAFVWLKTPGNSRLDQLAAGRAWLRLNLTTTKLGLALHPISQSLQEYREMAEVFEEVHSLLETKGFERVQMLGRLGYGPDAPPTPRWSLETRLKT